MGTAGVGAARVVQRVAVVRERSAADAEGYDLNFGLYGSDPTTPELERTPKPASISAISQITKANALPTALLAAYVP